MQNVYSEDPGELRQFPLNKCVLVPTLTIPTIESPKHSCRMFPRQEIIGISAIDLIWGFGTYIV
jgi:agmatine/peptidylarginine deiminase